MGRDRRNEKSNEHFTRMIRNTMEEPAWRALSSVAQALYPWLKLEWRGLNYNNNGKIELSVRQAAEKLGVSKNTAHKAFWDLQKKGFISLAKPACLGINGNGKSASWELTELAMPGRGLPEGRKLYRKWSEGNDYPFKKLSPNNPKGQNGKTKPCPKKKDSNVLPFKTVAN